MIGRLRLWSAYVLFAYVTTHLLNHALGLISLRVIEARPHLVRLSVAKPARPGRALWRAADPFHPGAVGDRAPPLVPALALGMDAARARHVDRPARRAACRRHTRGARLLRRAERLSLGAGLAGRRQLDRRRAAVRACPSSSGSTPASASTSPGACGPGTATGCRRSMPSRCWCRRPASPAPAIALRDFAELAQQPDFLREVFARAQGARCGERRPALHDRRQPDDRRGRAAARLPRRASGARFLGAARGRRPSHLQRPQDGRCADRPQRPRDEPHRRHPARLGVRRARPLLDLPRADRRADRALLPPPEPEEQKVLARVGAPENVRLACQLRPPPGRYRITPLLPASAGPVEAYRRQPQAHGGERYVAILFADIRGFTSISEGQLPYDVVFLLNRYFRATGQAVQAAGGRLDKFIGDGVMAIFGLDRDARGRLPPGARRGAAHGAGARRSQRGVVGRSRPAAAHRHRPACRAGDRRRDGLRARRLAHRDRRHGQHREPARDR